MPFHFCADELFMLLSLLPFIGVYGRRLHNWYHTKTNHRAHEDEAAPSVKESK